MAVVMFVDTELRFIERIGELNIEIKALKEEIEKLQEENNFLTGGMHVVKLAVEDLLCCQGSLNYRCVACEDKLKKAVENG